MRNKVLAALAIFAVLAIATIELVREDGVEEECRFLPGDGQISEAGHYCLADDVVTDREFAISIEAEDVVLDLEGHSVGTTHRIPVRGNFGIVIQNASNVTVRNGSISGFWHALSAKSVRGLTLENLAVRDIGYVGFEILNVENFILQKSNISAVVLDVERTEKEHYLIGANIQANWCVVRDNTVIGEYPGLESHENPVETVLFLFRAKTRACMVSNNLLKMQDPTPKSYGIWLANESEVAVFDNTIENPQYGIAVAYDAAPSLLANRLHFAADAALPGSRIESQGIHLSSRPSVLKHNTFSGYSSDIVYHDPALADPAN